MSYSSKPIWIPVDRDITLALNTGATSAVQTIETGGVGLSRGLIYGVQVTVNSSNGAGHEATVRMYSEATRTNIFYETEIDLSSNTGGSDTLATPIPVFSTPSYTVQDTGGNNSQVYTVLFLVRAMA